MVNKNVPDIYHQIVERLKAMVGGESARTFARTVGLPHTSVSNWISKRSEPSATAVAQICTNTGTSAHWLLTGEGPKNSKDIQSPGGVDRDDEFEEITEIVDLLQAAIRRGDMRTIDYVHGYLVAKGEAKREEEREQEEENKTKTGKKRA
ncbi:MAG: helix-turn-helix domain-containing protein [Myxococcales bacterium]|nr:helix-turn-helix domain-containing protein [Myxococcales bacterium]